MYIPTDDGRWVSEEFERLARIIQDYDQDLELRWIPPEHRTRDDKSPYCVFDTRVQQPVFFATELDTPESILARLFDSDNKQGNVLTRLEKQEAATKAMQLKAQADEWEDMHDQANFFKNSHLHTLKFNGKKFDHERRLILP